ncbi:MAG: hypothetical protein SH819_00520 [Cytophagales bacterium]|nr:hypothetical protein [Cytophagales bacterium]
MKSSILTLIASASLAMAILAGCNTPAENVSDAQKGVNEANADLDKANKAYLADVESYRKEAAEKIATNDRSIAEFNLRIRQEKQEARIAYEKKISALEQKNSDMKKRLQDYKAQGLENWKAFKAEFARDLDELGQGFKDFTVKNNK